MLMDKYLFLTFYLTQQKLRITVWNLIQADQNNYMYLEFQFAELYYNITASFS